MASRNSTPLMIRLLLGLALVRVSGAQAVAPRDEAGRLARFEQEVDSLRGRLKIPGLSAAIVKDQTVLWARGYGFADLENRIPATPNTLYSIASLTKTFASTMIMRLVEQGELELDEPISRYVPTFGGDSVRIKHLLSHTSSGTPGERFRYDGSRYDYLTAVIERKTGKSFVQGVAETFFDPLGMASSVPYHDIVVDENRWMATLGKERLDRYRVNLSRLAEPYAYYGAGETLHDSYPPRSAIGAAAGVLSTVLDLARYDMAIDRQVYLTRETQQRAWTPFVSNRGERLPYGLGWFVRDYREHTLVWHYGQWGTGFSAMYLRIPELHVAVILLSNSEALAGHGVEDATSNAFVCSFLGVWGLRYDCERESRSAMTKWMEDRRAAAPVAIRVDPGILETYVGQYRFASLGDRIYSVTREGDRLFLAEGSGGSRVELSAESESRFFLKARSYRFVFVRADGRSPVMNIVQGEVTYTSERTR